MRKFENDIEIYSEYLAIKSSKGRKVNEILEKYNITRGGLYSIIERMKNGNVYALRQCIEHSRMNCLWEYKYKAQFMAIPKDRTAPSVEVLKELINNMHKDGFNPSDMVQYLNKDRSTIIHHLSN